MTESFLVELVNLGFNKILVAFMKKRHLSLD